MDTTETLTAEHLQFIRDLTPVPRMIKCVPTCSMRQTSDVLILDIHLLVTDVNLHAVAPLVSVFFEEPQTFGSADHKL